MQSKDTILKHTSFSEYQGAMQRRTTYMYLTQIQERYLTTQIGIAHLHIKQVIKPQTTIRKQLELKNHVSDNLKREREVP